MTRLATCKGLQNSGNIAVFKMFNLDRKSFKHRYSHLDHLIRSVSVVWVWFEPFFKLLTAA